MPFLDYSYNLPMVLASVAISMMAAFTGLTLTRGLSARPVWERQARVAMGAVALGGGIWSMHFVAILSMNFPIQLAYDPLLTLGSALLAILLAGLALLIMHFAPRRRGTFALSGSILGAGIVTMHFTGMAGIERCLPVYGAGGIAAASVLAVVMGYAAISTAYGERRSRNILAATAIFGASVVVVHFTAMADTRFLAVDLTGLALPGIEDTALALIVMFSAFVICGAFLLTGATFFAPVPARAPAPAPGPAPAPQAAPDRSVRLPYEHNGQTAFLPSAEVAAIRAEGHYTIAYAGGRKLFCPWSISEAEKRLEGTRFMRVHRSYLVNLAHVTGFERRKDNGVCLLEETPSVTRVPVSRARISDLREALGI